MNAAPAAVPASCPDCGGDWIWRAAWWKSPAADPAWGYLVHCAEGHFHWFEAELAPGEFEQAKRRFAPVAETFRKLDFDVDPLPDGWSLHILD